ncbi:hypothetical protein I7I51_07264 [Histoplasma capsulatum]|uniref:Uncharacterized protein n=1 Tax=Ajellomyces capsulatus TaxID=5037 RepID=A0A8A1MQR9_AJECA|nr:hypothetical protein I7I51_07264 [Histoplasma capsulatum]
MARVFFEIAGNRSSAKCMHQYSRSKPKGQVQILGTGEHPSSAQAKVASPSQPIHEKWDDGSNPDPNTTKMILENQQDIWLSTQQSCLQGFNQSCNVQSQ